MNGPAPRDSRHGGSAPEPIPLERRGLQPTGTLAGEWFNEVPPYSVPPDLIPSQPPPPPLPSIARTVAAGTLVGAIGALVAIVTASVVSIKLGQPDYVRVVGNAVARGGHVQTLGFAAAAGGGAALGIAVALMTRHVRRGMPVALFVSLFAPIAWLAVHVLVLRRFAPWYASTFSFPAGAAGFAMFGVMLGAIVPVRGR